MIIIAAFFVMLLPWWVIILFVEYWAHRLVMHLPWHPHLTKHHIGRINQPVLVHVDLPIWWHLLAVTVTGLFPTQIYRIYHGSHFAIGSCIAMWCLLILHSYVWSKLHRSFHGIERNWTWDLACYDELKDHHLMHHTTESMNEKNPGCKVKNWGVMTDLFDRVFGTRWTWKDYLECQQKCGPLVSFKE